MRPFLILTIAGFFLNGVTGNTAECGFFLSLSQSQTGAISSPNYPNDYPDRTRCIWRFEAPVSHQVVMTSLSMQGERRGGRCRDFVQFRSGSRDGPVLEEICDAGFSVTSPARWLWVKFESDSNTTNVGFQATYSTMIAPPNASFIEPPVTSCRSYEFCCENKECIPWSYRCDGQNDCGCLAGCDEDGCGGSGLDRGAMIGIGLSCGLVLFLMLFCAVTLLDKKHHNVFFKKSNDKKSLSRRESRASVQSRLTNRARSALGWGSRANSTLHDWSRANTKLEVKA